MPASAAALQFLLLLVTGLEGSRRVRITRRGAPNRRAMCTGSARAACEAPIDASNGINAIISAAILTAAGRIQVPTWLYYVRHLQ